MFFSSIGLVGLAVWFVGGESFWTVRVPVWGCVCGKENESVVLDTSVICLKLQK